jgi:hypothetical protein
MADGRSREPGNGEDYCAQGPRPGPASPSTQSAQTSTTPPPAVVTSQCSGDACEIHRAVQGHPAQRAQSQGRPRPR